MFAFVEGFLDLSLSTFLIAFGGLQYVSIGGRGNQARVCMKPTLS